MLSRINKSRGSFGDKYSLRNTDVDVINNAYKNETGFTEQEVLEKFFREIDKNSKIIEIACNVGLKLTMLKRLGFKNLTGLEINKTAYEIAQKKSRHKFYSF